MSRIRNPPSPIRVIRIYLRLSSSASCPPLTVGLLTLSLESVKLRRIVVQHHPSKFDRARALNLSVVNHSSQRQRQCLPRSCIREPGDFAPIYFRPEREGVGAEENLVRITLQPVTQDFA